MLAPRAVDAVVPVDYYVRACPIDSYDFIDVLQRALYGSNKAKGSATMCGECKRNESSCFYAQGKLCLGMVTIAGCGAKCVNLGRPCNGCRGLSPDANVPAARVAVERYGLDPVRFDEALGMFNQTNPKLSGDE
jgi:coenzyme F420-reducing hydrogenase gamma subunit